MVSSKAWNYLLQYSVCVTYALYQISSTLSVDTETFKNSNDMESSNIKFHNDRTYKEHRNLEIRKHVTTLSYRFRHKEERHNLLCCLIHLAPISSGPHRAQVRIASASSKSRSSSFSVLTFFKFFSTNLCALPVRDVTRTPSPVSSRTIVTSLSDTFVRPRAPAFTPASMFAPN